MSYGRDEDSRPTAGSADDRSGSSEGQVADEAPGLRVEARIREIAALRVEAVAALAAADFATAAERTGTAITWADALLDDIADRPDLLDRAAAPVVLTAATLHGDMSIALLGMGELESARQHRNLMAELAVAGEQAIRRYVAIGTCVCGNSTYTGWCDDCSPGSRAST
jgi:hypothetical protein